MRIEKVYIKNFRCLRSVETTLDNLTVLVGRNGSGKSAVLHAIDVLFTPGANITEEDFFGRNTDESIEIEITFKDFTLEERVEFGAYIQDNKMRVIKIISYDKESNTSREEYFSFKTQIPSFAKIRELPGARDKTNALKELIAQGSLPSLEGNPRSESETLEIMESYEASHPELTELVKIKPHFFGARNIGGGKLDKYTKFIFLPAVKEVSEEVTGKDSSIDRLLEVLVLKEMETRSDLVKFREKVTRQIIDRLSPKRLGGLDGVSTRISKRLNLYSPGAALTLRWNEAEPPEIELPTVRCDVSEDGFEGIITKKGHGLQRALILTLLEYLSQISAVEEITNKGEQTAFKVKKLRIDTILAIEEPEIYLHPTRARYLAQILLNLAQSSKGLNTQIIYTTHSPIFVGMDRFDAIRVCRKANSGGKVPCTSIRLYDLESASSRLDEICDRKRKLANPRDNFRIRSAPVMNYIVNEGFFSDFVVLIEGPTDAAVLWKVQGTFRFKLG